MNSVQSLKKSLPVLRNFAKTFKQDAKRNSEFAMEFKKASTGVDKRPLYWTAVNDPTKHSSHHLANFYTVDPEHHKRWLFCGLEPSFYRCSSAFKEFSLMVRQPAIEVLDHLNKVADAPFPVLKFVLHGRNGCGKSSSLAHVLHYAGVRQWLIVHVPWAALFNRLKPGEVQYSTHSKTKRVDQPLAAVAFLSRFKHQNAELLARKDLRLKHAYVWNKREHNQPGDALLDVVDFGINRPKYATDVVGVLLKELKQTADCGAVKVLVVVDGVNAFWSLSNIKQEDNRLRFHPAGELSLVAFFKELLKSDWCNGAVVCSVDGNAQHPADPLKYLSLDLLGQEGFEHMDPFLPVHVPDYNDKEFYASLQFLFDKQWFAKAYSQTVDGVKEIRALSCMNPLEIYKLAVWM